MTEPARLTFTFFPEGQMVEFGGARMRVTRVTYEVDPGVDVPVVVHAGEGRAAGRVPSYERLGRAAFERHGDPDVRGWGLLDVAEREVWMGVAAAVVNELADDN